MNVSHEYLSHEFDYNSEKLKDNENALKKLRMKLKVYSIQQNYNSNSCQVISNTKFFILS